MKSQAFLNSVLFAVATVAVLAASVSPRRHVEPPQPPVANEAPAQGCQSPVVMAFEQIGAQGRELAERANAAPAPLEDTPESVIAARPRLADLAQRARALDVTTAQLLQPAAPLKPGELLLAQSLAAHVDRLRNLSVQAQSMLDVGGELDAALMVRRLDEMAVHGWEIARLVNDAAPCDAFPTISRSYAPIESCQALDPEYELAMHGACRY